MGFDERKNAVCPDPEQRSIPSLSKSTEFTASNKIIHVESFSEPLQLRIDEITTPTR